MTIGVGTEEGSGATAGTAGAAAKVVTVGTGCELAGGTGGVGTLGGLVAAGGFARGKGAIRYGTPPGDVSVAGIAGSSGGR
ncbi:MAG: hypothetical protein ACRENX_10585 [Candidatus Dormibacteria bacterium]